MLLLQQECRSQSVSAGIMSSPRHSGAFVGLTSKSGNNSAIRVYADISNVISGKFREPDLLADYHILLNVIEKQVNDGLALKFNAGPGVFAGYTVSDVYTSAVGGLSGIASLDFKFKVPVWISLSFTCQLGFKISPDSNREEHTVELYRNGLARSWIPALTIAYSF